MTPDVTPGLTSLATPVAETRAARGAGGLALWPLQVSARRLLVLLSVLVLLPLTLWQAYVWSGRAALTSIEQEAAQKIALYVANLRGELDKYEYLPRVLARDPAVIGLLADPGNRAMVDTVNRRLEDINGDAEASDTYVMAADGTTLAASNWRQDTSFVGQNFEFRPYYRIAMGGGQGRYFALGTTSLKAGYYLSHAVYGGDGAVLGVIVVKVSVAGLEAAWAQGPFRVMVSDPNGVVFMSTVPEWKFHTLAPLPPERQRAIIASRQYHTAPLDPLPVTGRREGADGQTLMTLAGAGTFLAQSASVPDTDWTLHALSPITRVGRLQLASVAAAGAAFGILLLAALYLSLRRLRLDERLAHQRELAAALERANTELETRVERRTADLSAVNRELRSQVDENRRAQEELRLAQDELVQAGKLAVLGQISSGINHEINQPLGAIRAYADNARAYLDRQRFPEVRENLESISELTDRMAAIITRLKGFARRSEGVNRAVPLRPCIDNALELLRRRIRDQEVEVRLDLPDPAPLVVGDSVRLEQVLVNLIGNALDAMAEAPRRVLTLAVTEDGREVAVRIRDTGAGIAPAARGRVFDPFFTTKDSERGLGLGLSISLGIVRDFGGALTVEDPADGAPGACFAVTLRQAEMGRRPTP
ncbi:MAG: sensor histidine kinase [Hyphomicrobiales bacterium]|nr:sensor histidine kinase [Hyphomicrobiales bacterium]